MQGIRPPTRGAHFSCSPCVLCGRTKNRIVFDNAIPNPSLHKICLSQALEYSFCVSKSKLTAPKGVIPVRSIKPLEGWHKLNTDGASFGNPGKAGGGGIIRDSQGNWIKGYSRSIGFTTSNIAELWALRDGLNLAIQLGLQQIEVELDAKVIVDLLNSNNNPNTAYSPLLSDCRLLLAGIPQVRVAHVFREANKCVDLLAKKGCSMQEDFALFDFLPSFDFDTILAMDCNGLHYCRLVTANLAKLDLVLLRVVSPIFLLSIAWIDMFVLMHL